MVNERDSGHRKNWFPLRMTVPLSLLLFIAGTTWWSLQAARSQASRVVESEAVRELNRTLTRLDSTIERAARNSDAEAIQAEVVALAVDPHVICAALCNEHYQVISSIHLADIDQPLESIVPPVCKGLAILSHERLEQLKSSWAGTAEVVHGGDSAVGVQPVMLGREEGGLRPTRMGTLVIARNLLPQKRREYRAMRSQVVGFATVLSLFAVGLGVFFHFRVTSRIGTLTQLTRDVATGDLTVRSGIHGRGEVAELAAALDGMIADRKQSEQELRIKDLAIESAVTGICFTDLRGRITEYNPAFQRMWGAENTGDLRGKTVTDLGTDPVVVGQILEAIRSVGSWQGEDLARRLDGTPMHIQMATTLIVGTDGEPVGMMGTFGDITERKRLEKEILEIAAEEDRRIGQELHDGTQQELTGLSLMAQNIVDTLDRIAQDEQTPEASTSGDVGHLRTVAHRLSDGLQRANKNVQMLSRGLIPVEVDSRGLMSALTELASRTSIRAVDCTFVCEEPVEVADNFTATHLYRIAQESITNALKHGAPDRIEISLSERDACVILHVLDNGTGIANNHSRNGGMGLGIMRYRAGMIGASLSIDTGPKGGTSVTCTVSPN